MVFPVTGTRVAFTATLQHLLCRTERTEVKVLTRTAVMLREITVITNRDQYVATCHIHYCALRFCPATSFELC
jgi:hypothetical protein